MTKGNKNILLLVVFKLLDFKLDLKATKSVQLIHFIFPNFVHNIKYQ